MPPDGGGVKGDMVSGESRIEVDPDLCVGTGECVRIAPAAFALDECDDVARVLPTRSEHELEDLEDAAMNCPTQAITVYGPDGQPRT